MIGPFARGLLLVLLCASIAHAQTGGLTTSQRPPCPEAPDDQYGFTRDRAIQVGGSPLYGAARQRRYLESLRGPAGQTITYKRLGQANAPDGTILDSYEVTYEGLEKPVTLYLDWYHYSEPHLPRGFSCAGPFTLGLPPVDPFQESDQRRALAVAQAATIDVSPIPLQLEGKPAAGVIYDDFRLMALAARAAAARGAALDPADPIPALGGIGMIVIVYPYPCESRVLPAAGNAIAAANGQLVPRAQLSSLSAERLAQALPGVTIPPGAKAFAYQLGRPRPNDNVVLSFLENGCEVQRNTLQFRVHATPPKLLDSPGPAIPEGVKTPATVYLQAMIDFDGRFQQPVVIGGPAELVAAARAAIEKWRAEPARLNGAPVATAVLLQVRFGS